MALFNFTLETNNSSGNGSYQTACLAQQTGEPGVEVW